MEIRVSKEEFKKIKRQKEDVQKRFYQLDKLEATLKALQFKFLSEKKEHLAKRLEEIEEHYEQLLLFIERARSDKEVMMKLREMISRENKELRKELEEKA